MVANRGIKGAVRLVQDQAVYFHLSLPRVAIQRVWPYKSRQLAAASLRLAPIATPELPSRWVEVRPRLSGICGSDRALVHGRSSAFLTPLTSFPAVLGHEVVADVVATGQRVVVNPSLSCQARRLPACHFCVQGRPDECLRRTDPGLGPGLILGYNARMPGGWSQRMWVPEEQCVSVPKAMPDERAVLTEPAAIVLTGLKTLEWGSCRNVLVVGCGTLGQLSIALISELYPAVKIVALARYPSQQSRALAMGAAQVTGDPTKDREVLRILGSPLKTLLGHPPYYPHGFDIVIVTAPSPSALSQALSFAHSQGQVLVLGGAGKVSVDWTPVWSRSIRVSGSYGYGDSGVDTFRAVLSLFSVMARPLETLITHSHSLKEYRQAIARVSGGPDAIKVVFRPNSR